MRWYTAALKYLEEEGALRANVHPANISGDLLYVLGERALELLEHV